MGPPVYYGRSMSSNKYQILSCSFLWLAETNHFLASSALKPHCKWWYQNPQSRSPKTSFFGACFAQHGSTEIILFRKSADQSLAMAPLPRLACGWFLLTPLFSFSGINESSFRGDEDKYPRWFPAPWFSDRVRLRWPHLKPKAIRHISRDAAVSNTVFQSYFTFRDHWRVT